MSCAYLKEKKGRIVLDLIFIAVFAVCFFLMGAGLYLVWYPAAICAVIFVLYILWDYYRFTKKHKLLQKVYHHIDETADYLPTAKSPLEADYQQLLRAVLASYKDRLKHSNEKLAGNKEYITLWAHQIKTPLTALELMTGELCGANVDEKKKELAGRLFEVEQYVDMSLQYMRLDTLTADLILREYHLFTIVKQAVKYFARIFIAKRISLRMDETDVVVATDQKWLLFVLKQILSNALKYTKEGSILVYMHADKASVLVIEDTGIGIAAEDLPRIFERGYTGCNGRIQEKSTGIGLYLSKLVLERLGHGIAISSKEGSGTKVEIMLGRDCVSLGS